MVCELSMRPNFTQNSDDELIEIIRAKGNYVEQAFEEIYERYASRLYAYCRRAQNSRELAEDIFQETFYRFYNKIININTSSKNKKGTDEYSDNEQFEYSKKFSVMGFLITVARNLCINKQKKTVPFTSINDITLMDEYNLLNFTDNDTNKDELSELAIMVLDFLEPDNKEVIILRYYVNMEYSEIAEIFGTTPNAIRVKVHRAKSKIKTILSDYEKKL